MKRFLIIFLMLCGLACGAEVTVTTPAALQTAINADKSTPIHLNAALFTLTAHLTIDYDLVMDVVNQNAEINGSDLYGIETSNSTGTYGNATGDFTLTINSCGNGTQRHFNIVKSDAGGNTVILNYMDFKNGNNGGGSTGTGCRIDGQAGTLLVTANYCNAYSNDMDGFSQTGVGLSTVTLNNCNSYSNGDGVTGGAGDGMSTHKSTNTCIINGGSYHDNWKAGVYNVGETTTTGGDCYISGDALFYANGQPNAAASYADIFIDDGCRMYIDGAEFKELDLETSSGYHILTALESNIANASNAVVQIHNATFRDPLGSAAGGGPGSSGSYVSLRSNLSTEIKGCIFKNLLKGANAWSVKTYGPGLTVSNTTFTNNTRGISTNTQLAWIYNNIFDSMESYAISAGGKYTQMALSGYNCFWNSGTADFLSGDDSLASTDLTVDPMLNASDVSQNPALEDGKPDISGKGTTIGAAQPATTDIMTITIMGPSGSIFP